MAVKTLTEATFKEEVLQANQPVLVDFYADWCGPCRMLRPTLEELSEERTDVKFAAINIDDNPELADDFDISSIPCVILFKNGAEADRSVGLVPKEALEDFLG
jgi:thioredoxin 1